MNVMFIWLGAAMRVRTAFLLSLLSAWIVSHASASIVLHQDVIICAPKRESRSEAATDQSLPARDCEDRDDSGPRYTAKATAPTGARRNLTAEPNSGHGGSMADLSPVPGQLRPPGGYRPSGETYVFRPQVWMPGVFRPPELWPQNSEGLCTRI
jgi:hypothetical protein